MDTFKAWLVTRDEATKQQSVAITTLTPADLMPGDVDVRVEYSTINYKDGLAITGKLPVVRRFPMIPGTDFAGTVVASGHPAYQPGDKVVLNGWGIGETHFGAFSQMARVNADWLIPLPDGISPRDAMAVGTAGYTAMLAIMALEHQGLTPEAGTVVVTGAAGGVGSMAIALLSSLGYAVEAVTGRPEEAGYLTGLGAGGIVGRAELSGTPKLLARERWAAGIDSVGGPILANVLAATQHGGAVAACGNAAGMELATSVAPFILRGVALLGIESSHAEKDLRLRAWRRVATDLDRDKLAAITSTISFDGIADAARAIAAGQVRGRIVVEIG
jgi:acrylyl-CoA reductase (NADPH)